MRTRQKLTILAVLAIAAIAALWIARPWRSEGKATSDGPGTAAAGAGGIAASAGSASASGSAAALPADQAELVAYLRARFGAKIANRYVQIQMLEKLMRHFQAQDPAGWKAALLAALRAAFPERFEELAANLQHRLAYEEWLSRNHERLRGLGERERREALWEERKRLFGEEAAGEIWASERKGQSLTDALAAIDAQPDASVGQRLEQYKESLLETHQEHADTYLQNHRQEALQRFLGLDSVQRELSALSPAERTAALRTVREGLGLDAAALERWDALDVERDRRWDVGQKYMAERNALAKQYSGEALEARVQELRTRYFGAEAATIGDEEASGFFRFDRPRKYGLN
jgi:hypothetical protein